MQSNNERGEVKGFHSKAVKTKYALNPGSSLLSYIIEYVGSVY